MKKYALLACAILVFSACFDQEGSAEVTFENKSQYDIENIWDAADEVIPLLRPGESVTNTIHFLVGSATVHDCTFYINGKKYGTQVTDEERAKAGEAEGYRFKSKMRIHDGDSFTITVYSEYYWTIKKN